MQAIIKQWSILSLLPVCTTDAGLSIIDLFLNFYRIFGVSHQRIISQSCICDMWRFHCKNKWPICYHFLSDIFKWSLLLISEIIIFLLPGYDLIGLVYTPVKLSSFVNNSYFCDTTMYSRPIYNRLGIKSQTVFHTSWAGFALTSRSHHGPFSVSKLFADLP